MQNNLNWHNLDILHRCPQAPIPNLGQGAPPPSSQAPPPGAQPPASGEQTGPTDSQAHTSVSQTPPTYSQAQHQQSMSVVGTSSLPAPPGGVVQSPPGIPTGGDDDFADFQAAPSGPAANTGKDRKI